MKKAWLREYELMCGAKPKILREEEQGWLFSRKVEEMDDIMLKSKWSSTVPGSNAPERVIIGAIADYGNMGYDVSEAEALIGEGLGYLEKNDMANLNRVTWRIWNILNNAKKIEGHPYFEYEVFDSLEKIYAGIDCGRNYPKVDKNGEKYLSQTYYGWLAQIVGGALGTAIEGYTTENIREAFGEIYGYVREPNTYNDDITYEVAFLRALERKGKNLISADIAEEWAALITFGWSAEEWALKNIKSGIYPPRSGYENNPYREWIGAQMRGAVCGQVAPANPLLALKLAYTDGVVSHHNNGVLGEIFNAVLVSLSYVLTDVKRLLIEAVSYIPKTSEYYSVVDFALKTCEAHGEWESAWGILREKYKIYNWIHAYPNAVAEVVALYFGGGDFDETMHIISMIGFDADCNAAQIATCLGIIHQDKAMREKWTKPIGDTLKTYIRNHETMSIKQLAKDTVNAAKLLD